MAFFIVHMHHPDEPGWRRHLGAHLAYLRELLAEGPLVASGPLTGLPVRAGFLIIKAPDAAGARAIVEADPFWIEGLAADLSIVEWDPIFGAFNSQSTRPGVDGDPPLP